MGKHGLSHNYPNPSDFLNKHLLTLLLPELFVLVVPPGRPAHAQTELLVLCVGEGEVRVELRPGGGWLVHLEEEGGDAGVGRRHRAVVGGKVLGEEKLGSGENFNKGTCTISLGEIISTFVRCIGVFVSKNSLDIYQI